MDDALTRGFYFLMDGGRCDQRLSEKVKGDCEVSSKSCSRTQTNKPLDQSSSGFLLPETRRSQSDRGSHVEALGAQSRRGGRLDHVCESRRSIVVAGVADASRGAASFIKGVGTILASSQSGNGFQQPKSVPLAYLDR